MASDDPRFDKPWGTPEEVEAAFRAGWDIDSGPSPHRHTLPPPSTTDGTDVDGNDFRHNGIEPTDADPLFTEDGAPNAILLAALAEAEKA